MSKGTRVFVGNLPRGVETRDVESMFRKYGRILYVDMKNRGGGRSDERGPPFAFVEFEDSRDADDAVAERDGMTYQNSKLRVEFPRGEARGRGGARGRSPDRRFPGDGIGRSSLRRSSYRVSVSGLPVTLSWQDLKDHMRDAGEVCFAEVFRDGTGLVEFRDHEGVLNAVEKMNDTKIRSREGDTAIIRIKEDNAGGGSSSRARSRSRSRSRGRSYSPPARRGKGRRSPSSSPPRRARGGRSRSDSRSRSRSNPRTLADERK